ncbi:hypothetical protein Pmani_033506 [Petrolisthes manimaculis]|uniref:Uncharacterized protein n=1 Tax=Petrolisthes manimaculis TaxID=1843537 RepID=A0AAE1TSK4_9EUCA|nr:hypothetical protein Pmani_033506 [Petrolisthes manimaculis]
MRVRYTDRQTDAGPNTLWVLKILSSEPESLLGTGLCRNRGHDITTRLEMYVTVAAAAAAAAVNLPTKGVITWISFALSILEVVEA